MHGTAPEQAAIGTPAEVFATFLKLGLTSFGGPVAHLGYFRQELVIRRRWLDDRAYADLVALCQFLPGPASSQVGFALGLMRAGWRGGIAAFAAFTLPSALLMIGFALGAAALSGPVGRGALSGLKIVAVAIVAQAVLGMARSLCPDRTRATIAVAAVAVLALVPGPAGMIAAIASGALAGWALGAGSAAGPGNGPAASGAAGAVPVSPRVGLAAILAFLVLLGALPVLAGQAQVLALIDGFYRAGALVFGGGHVVLPLLQAEMVASGRVDEAAFLAGYGAAQAVPGPLFSFAAYLGAVMAGVGGAVIALAAIFVPGFLLLIGVLPFWDRFRVLAPAQALMRGANAAVVGILGAALYAPVLTGAITGLPQFALALACAVALVAWRAPAWAVVILGALGGVGLGLVGAA